MQAKNTIVSIIGILVLLLAGCAPAAAPTPTTKPTAAPVKVETPAAKPTVAPSAPSPTPKPAAEQPRYGGTLTRVVYEDPGHLDVHQVALGPALHALPNVYNGLARFHPLEHDKIIPDLAEKWEISPDGLTYTFYLRKGVKWHDGKPFTSADAKITIDRMAFWKEYKIVSPRGQQLFFALDRVETPTDDTVKVSLKHPSASFLSNIASGAVMVLPKHILDVKGDMKKDAIGTGAFKFKSWNFGVSMEMVKNPDYFVKGLPYLDGITFYVIKDSATRFAAFRTGQVKMTGIGSPAMSHSQAELARRELADKITVAQHPALRRFMFFSNVKRKPWDDLKVRKAADLTLDRQGAIKLHDNVGTIGAALDPKGVWGIKESDMTKRPGYRQPKDADVAEAKKLLADAGYPTGLKAGMLTRSTGDTPQVAEVMKEQLGKIGIDVTLEPKETAVAEDRANRHDFDTMCWAVADPFDDPDIAIGGYYTTGTGRNYGAFSDKAIDQLYEKQSRTLDTAERKKLVIEIQERLLEVSIYPILFWDVYNLGFWKEVKGYMPGPGFLSFNNLDHVWLAK